MSFSSGTIVCNNAEKKPILYPKQGRRSYFLLVNNSSAVVYVSFGTIATEMSIPVKPNGLYELEHAVPQGEIHIAGSLSTDQFLAVTEG